MILATPEQFQTAINNFRRHASISRASAQTFPEGAWQRDADLRNARKFDNQADALESRMKVLYA